MRFDFVFLHPIRAVKIALRRWTLAADARDPRLPDDVPPALRQFTVGESFPWKGTRFRVGKIIGGDLPCLIILPCGPTHGEKLRGLRRARETFRQVRKDRRAIAASL